MEISAKDWWDNEQKGLKHLEGTEHDHDQQSHGNEVGGSSASSSGYKEGKTIDECKKNLRESFNIGNVVASAKISDDKKISIMNAIGKRFDWIKQTTNNAFSVKLNNLVISTVIINSQGKKLESSVSGLYIPSERSITLLATISKNKLVENAAHELGHHVDHNVVKDSFYAKVYSQFTKQQIQSKISWYAGTNEREGFAEAFKIWTSEKYKNGKLPREVEKFFEDNLQTTKKDLGLPSILKHTPGGYDHDQQSHAGGKQSSGQLAKEIRQFGGDSDRDAEAIREEYGSLMERFPKLRTVPPVDRLNIVDEGTIGAYVGFDSLADAMLTEEVRDDWDARNSMNYVGSNGLHCFDTRTGEGTITIAGRERDDWEGTSELVLGRSNVSLAPRDTFRHEFGHHVLITRAREQGGRTSEIFKDFNALEPTAKEVLSISRYAGTSGNELFAEAFSAYTHPRYKRGLLPKKIEDFMDKWVGESEKKSLGLFKHLPGQHDQDSHGRRDGGSGNGIREANKAAGKPFPALDPNTENYQERRWTDYTDRGEEILLGLSGTLEDGIGKIEEAENEVDSAQSGYWKWREENKGAATEEEDRRQRGLLLGKYENRDQIQRRAVGRFRSLLYEVFDKGDGERLRIINQEDWEQNKRWKGSINEALDFMQKTTGSVGLPSLSIEVLSGRAATGSAGEMDSALRVMRLRRNGPEASNAAVVLHELGHYVEDRARGIRDSTNAYLKMRTKNDKIENYRGDDIKRDKFAEPYMGKQYGWPSRATEVLSIGLEKLYGDPHTFFKKDRQTFAFMLGMMSALQQAKRR